MPFIWGNLMSVNKNITYLSLKHLLLKAELVTRKLHLKKGSHFKFPLLIKTLSYLAFYDIIFIFFLVCR